MPPRLILLGGPSGSGKSYMARRFGRPHLILDSFYREAAEHHTAIARGEESPLPLTPYGEIDWDHPGTWNCEAAAAATLRLLAKGSAEIPEYSIAASAITGSTTVRSGAGAVVAEGIFVGELLPVLREAGTAVEAWFITEPGWITALRRLARDVAERRKPLPFLLRRGWALLQEERPLRERYLASGFEAVSRREVKRRLAAAGQGKLSSSAG